ncbi:DUF5689 domain-containing protein [Niabella ginsengisoli]|uniref:DUF5689 domain-containing protein n=1 Tax=Niabella ginsengisoli TaxID=522298 RepID=A0ABS9SP04_9BACT|nr:DUF5689 domain-containing protein [Niabella ginsengisoli]MCH5600133.1 DUF5689 domain-containing protein [Niabella ginsengisoli]
MKNFGFFLIAMVAIAASCNRQFDAPPENVDPEIDVTMSIMDLKARYKATGNFKRIEDEQIISGIVIADDRSGNFYKQIIIQDETGGIPVLLDGNNVYTQYPVGRRVFIKLKGMMLGDYGGTIQVGLDSSRSSDGRFLNLDGIPQVMFDEYIIKGSFNNTVTPKLISPDDFINNMKDPLLSTLVQINNAEFRDADIDKTYADASKNVSAVNLTIKTCNKESVVLRNSSYAKFAALNVPDGNGVLTAIPSIFNETMQLFIRDTADVQFNNTRCSGQVPIPTLKTIAELKIYATGDSSIPAGVFIKGVVVSDVKNESTGNYRLQDATAGIQLRFKTASNPDAVVGDSLTVTVGGLSLSQFNGGLQINNVETVTKSGTGVITPRTATVAAIIENNRTWESTVVMINNVTITKEYETNSGASYIIRDATGQLSSFIRNTSGITMPTNATSIAGYVSLYQSSNSGSQLETQITLRSQDDIIGGSGGAFSATYDFADVKNSTGTTDPTAPPTTEGLTFSNFTAVGVSANSSASARFSFSSWPTGAENSSNDFTGAINLSKYYEVTITPASGKQMDLTKITFTLQRSSTGVRQASLRSSIDAYSSNLPASIDPENENLSVVNANIFQVTDEVTNAQNGCAIMLGAAYVNISGSVTFRFYGFNAESTGGSFSIDNVKFEGVVK